MSGFGSLTYPQLSYAGTPTCIATMPHTQCTVTGASSRERSAPNLLSSHLSSIEETSRRGMDGKP